MINQIQFIITVFFVSFFISSCTPKLRNDDIKNQTFLMINDSTVRETDFFPNTKKKKKECHFNREEKLSGKYYEWDGDGNLILDWNFYNGVRDGEQIMYWGNGEKNYVENYYRGKRHGVVMSFTKAGDTLSEEHYEMGTLIYRKVCKDYYKPSTEMLHGFMSTGIDSATADSLLRINFQGYILQTDSGMFIHSDSAVMFKMDSIKQKLNELNKRKKS